MNCPACGFENRGDAGFCGECGASLAREIRCPRCQRSNPPGRKFCDGCGAETTAYTIRFNPKRELCSKCYSPARTCAAQEHPMLGKSDAMKKTCWPPPPDGYSTCEVPEKHL